jgi:uncharacterized protein (TIGR02246 family)
MNASTETDRAAILELLDRVEAAWARGDGAAYAAEFTADASYVTWVGTLYIGRKDIARSHQVLFAKFLKGTRIFGRVERIRFLGPDAAVVTSRGDTYKGSKQPRKLTKVQTYTVVREADGAWRVAAFQNTKRHNVMEAISFKFAPETAPGLTR